MAPTRIDVTEEMLRAGETVRIQAFGQSMKPSIASGDLLVVAPDPITEMGVGDVVLCRIGSHLLAHRIARGETTEDGPRFLLRGDRAGRADGWVGAREVLGRVVALERNGTRIAVPYDPAVLLARRIVGGVRRHARAVVDASVDALRVPTRRLAT